MPNFTILGVSHSPLFLEMAKIWPFYGQNMVLTWPEARGTAKNKTMGVSKPTEYFKTRPDVSKVGQLNTT